MYKTTLKTTVLADLQKNGEPKKICFKSQDKIINLFQL